MKVIHRCILIAYICSRQSIVSAYSMYENANYPNTRAIDQYYQEWKNYDPYYERNGAWADAYDTQQIVPQYYEVKPIINARGSHKQCQIIQSFAVGYPLFRTFGLDIPLERSYILKYRVRWYNGVRSAWYTLGKGDINQYPGFGYPVRVWANFDDHDFEFMACGSDSSIQYSDTDTYRATADDSDDNATQRSNFMQQQARDYYGYPAANYQEHNSASYGSNTSSYTTTSHKQKAKDLDPNDYGFMNGRYKGRVYFENPQSDSPDLKIPNFGENYTSFF